MVSGILTILMLLPSLVGSALAAPTPTIDAIRQAGKFKVAIDVTYPPMETTDAKGNPDGFDVDLAKEFARRLGVQVEFVVMSWDGIIAGLMSKRYDMICSAMNITPERLRQLDIVEYMQVSQVFVSPVDKPVVKEADLAGKTVAVQVDTTSATYVEKAKKNGLAIAGIKGFKMATDALAALRAKQADVIVIDEPVGQYFVKQDPKRVVVSGRAIAPEPIGVALRKDTKDLSAEVTRMIADMRRDGTMKKLHIKWFGVELGS
jgi:polar amino acid transport system substrate-binding protein